MRVDVTARRDGEHYMTECSVCGPLGVIRVGEAVQMIREHLQSHGVQDIEEGATSE